MATGVNDPYVVVSDKEVRAGTGKGWAEWVALLDAWDSEYKGFDLVVDCLIQQHGLNDFWAQAVAVYYRWGQLASEK